MSARSHRRGGRYTPPLTHLHFVGIGPAEGWTLGVSSRLIRKACTECRSEGLRWFKGQEMWELPGYPEAVELFAPDGVEEAWQCEGCGETGFFGPTVFEP